MSGTPASGRGYELIAILLGAIGLGAIWAGVAGRYWRYAGARAGVSPPLLPENALLAIAGAVAVSVSVWLLYRTLRGRRH